MLYNRLNDFEPDHDGVYRNSPAFVIASRAWTTAADDAAENNES